MKTIKIGLIHLPNRDEYYFRNQMVLDLSNPKVQDHVFGVVDKLMTKYPGIAFFKWDCNSPISNIYSMYLKENQSHLYIDYVRGLYKVLDRIKAKYPDLPMMLCPVVADVLIRSLEIFYRVLAKRQYRPIERLFTNGDFLRYFPVNIVCSLYHLESWNRH